MRKIILLVLALFSVSLLSAQSSDNLSRKYGTKIHSSFRTRHGGPYRIFNTNDYIRKQKRLDERIKDMEYTIAGLKKQKSDLKREYLRMLDEKIKAKNTDIERLKKERTEISSEKARVNAAGREISREKLDSRLSEKKREIQSLKEMKEKIDTSGND